MMPTCENPTRQRRRAERAAGNPAAWRGSIDPARLSVRASGAVRSALMATLAAVTLSACTRPASPPQAAPPTILALDGHVILLDDGVKPEILAAVKARVEEVVGLRVDVRPNSVDLSRALVPDREKYDLSRMLRLVAQHLDGADGRVLLLTPKDTFGDELNWSTGRSYVGGPIALVSTHRLDPAFWGADPDAALEARRACKIALHELGHTFGRSEHCLRWECCVHGSGSIDEIDLTGADYCADCRALKDAATSRLGVRRGG